MQMLLATTMPPNVDPQTAFVMMVLLVLRNSAETALELSETRPHPETIPVSPANVPEPVGAKAIVKIWRVSVAGIIKIKMAMSLFKFEGLYAA